MEQYYVKRIRSFVECEKFVHRFNADNSFSDTMLSSDEQITNNLIKAIDNKENHRVIGIHKNNVMIGLFSFLVLADEHYIEMLVGLSNYKEAYDVMYSYLKEHFCTYNVDFVFNSNNYLLYDLLKQNGAEFDVEQQKMIYSNSVLNIDTVGVELLTQQFIDSYLEMHNKDLYWTGDKVIEATDRFHTFIAIENDIIVGYLDVTHCFEENEPYDLLIKKDYRRKGYGKKLLAKALKMNAHKGMMVYIEIDNEPAICLYRSVGFVKVDNQNILVAHLRI